MLFWWGKIIFGSGKIQEFKKRNLVGTLVWLLASFIVSPETRILWCFCDILVGELCWKHGVGWQSSRLSIQVSCYMHHIHVCLCLLRCVIVVNYCKNMDVLILHCELQDGAVHLQGSCWNYQMKCRFKCPGWFDIRDDIWSYIFWIVNYQIKCMRAYIYCGLLDDDWHMKCHASISCECIYPCIHAPSDILNYHLTGNFRNSAHPSEHPMGVY